MPVETGQQTQAQALRVIVGRGGTDLDRLFEPLHEYKNHVLTAKHLLLDWIHLAQDPSPKNKAEINRALARLQEVCVCLDDQHRVLIQSLTRLTPP